MKKKTMGILSIILLIGAVFLWGCGKPNQSQASYIGIEEAKSIALEDAGVQTADAVFLAASLEERDDVEYYDVDFVSGGMEMEYDIDAITGVIIDSSKQEATPEILERAEAIKNGLIDSGSENGGIGSGNGQSGAKGMNQSGDIGADRAKEIALADAGLSESEVTFISADLDYDDGRQVYDVEFYTADYKEYDYEIEAASGTILGKDFDAEHYGGQSGSVQGGQSSGGETISEAEAEKIALAKVPGATNVSKMKLERDDGRMKYEGTIIYNEMEYDFEIDGYSGVILEWEVESVYD